MKLSLYAGILLASLLSICSGKIWEIGIPTTLQECYDQVRHADVSTYVGSTYSWFCETAIKKSQMNGPSTFDPQKMGYYQHLYDRSVEFVPVTSRGGRRLFRHRGKRQAGRARCLRREYRMMTDTQRINFHNALNALKQDTTVEPNKFDAIALLHTGMAAFTAHGGAGFPGWHRIYILMFETALREVDDSVCLPYWDSSLDAELEDPTLSPVWNNNFFGSAQGAVTEGPYSNWMTPEGGQLMRNVGADGDPFTASAVEDILTRTSHIDILTSEDTEPRYDLEFHHAAVHVYVGGTMGQLDTAAFDPVFFLHHAFVDYLWELFRTNLRGMGIDPEEYPEISDTESRHHSSAQTGFGNMTQADGYSDFLTQSYEYEAAPICSARFPECGSIYLTCFEDIGRCVPIDPEVDEVDPTPTEPITTPAPRPTPGQPQPTTGRPFVNPPQTTAGQPNRPRPTTNRPFPNRPQPTTGRPIPNRPRPTTFRPIPTQPHRPHPGHQTNRPQVHPIPNRPNPGNTFPNTSPNVNPFFPEPTFPNAGACSNVKNAKRYGNAVQNGYCCDKTCDTNQWATIPVKIVSVRPPKFNTYDSYPVRGGRVQTGSDIYAPSAYSETNRYISSRMANPKTYKRCGGDEMVGQVFLTSKGINYDGYYKEAAIVDNRLAASISMGFINVKKPNRGSTTQALLRAHDSCGRVCHAACKDPKTGEYKDCSGAVAISNDGPLMYGNTYDQAVMSVFDFEFNNNCPAFKSDNFFITFYCDYHNEFPYVKHVHGEKHAPKPKVVRPVPVVIPKSTTGCQVTPSCVLDQACTAEKQCLGFTQAAACRGSCSQYAICLYGRYFVKNCPEGQRFDSNQERCVPGWCHNRPMVQSNPAYTHSHNGLTHTHGVPNTAFNNRVISTVNLNNGLNNVISNGLNHGLNNGINTGLSYGQTHNNGLSTGIINGNRVMLNPRVRVSNISGGSYLHRAHTLNTYRGSRFRTVPKATRITPIQSQSSARQTPRPYYSSLMTGYLKQFRGK